MKAKYNHLPLKAYEVYEKGDYPFSQDYSFGIFAGRTSGQARAQVAQEREIDNPWRWLRSRRIGGLEAQAAIEAHEDRGKYWKKTRAFARLQATADEFNANWPVGTPVQVVGCGEAECWPDGITLTRTPAWVPSMSGVLVSVEGYAGGFGLEYIEPLIEPAATPTKQEGNGQGI